MASRLHALTADLASRTGPKLDDSANAPAAEKRPLTEEARFPSVPVGSSATRPKTGPGQMMAFRTQMLATDGELEKLREQLKQYDGSIPAIKVAPKLIHRTKWANRDFSAFKTSEFASLKAEIASAEGNKQPILIRPLKDRAGEYEIAFGHRRHQACLELGIDVLALVAPAEMPDSELFIVMDRENRERSDLSPFEQGRMYSQALEERLFSSARQMADALGVSNAWISKTMSVANLPPPILEAFASRLEIQPAQAKQIHDALEKDQRMVLKRAEKIRGQQLKAVAVTDFLLNGAKASPPKKVDIGVGDRKLGSMKRDANGAVVITLSPGAVTEQSTEIVLDAIRSALKSAGS